MFVNLLAHVKWFESGEDMAFVSATSTQLLAALGFVIVGVLVFLVLERVLLTYEKKLAAKLKPLIAYAPTVLRITLGLALTVFAARGEFLAPNIVTATSTSVSSGLLALEFLVGSLLILGLMTRAASVGLVVLYFLQLFTSPAINLLEHLEYVGSAIFLFVMGPGRYSVDELFGAVPKLQKDSARKAILTLQFCVGTSLLTLGLSEKLFNVNLAQSFLADYRWNFLSIIKVPDPWFIVFIGACEVLFGILLILNISTRLVITLVAATMFITAALLGPTEVVGHLFAIGIFFAIWTMVEPEASNLLPAKLSVKK